MLRRVAPRLAALLLLVSSACSAVEPKKVAVPLARKPKLAIAISVDGLAYDRLMRYRPYYGAGLKRLLDEGLLHSKANYQHLNTETGPGHAALGTGAPPRVTGIVANRWFDGKTLKEVYCTNQAPPNASPGSTETIPGPANLRVKTLGDRLVETFPSARVVSLSGKDRGAIFMAGHDPNHAVYWWDQETGRFVTSAAYNDKGRDIVRRFNRTKAAGTLPARLGLVWQKLPGTPDKSWPKPAPGMEYYQLPLNGLGFGHDLSKNSSGYYGGIYSSPFIDELTMDLALAVLDDGKLELGHRDDVPDLLCLSFSAQDVVSHNYGNESEENLDVLRRLDVQLGRLFDFVDKSFPKGTVVMALSADHGFTPIPEVEKKGGRVVTARESSASFIPRINRIVDEELCLDTAIARPIYGSEGWNVSYNRAAFPLKTVEGTCGPAGRSVTAADVDAVFPRLVTKHYREEIEKVLLVSQRPTWDKADRAVGFAENDFDAERSGDAILIPKPNVLMHWDPGRGSGHGSHHATDTHVPLVFWGGSIEARTSNDEVAPYDFAPTLGKLLGVTLPQATGRALLP